MGYDSVGRITSFNVTGSSSNTAGFGYDANGNRSSSTRVVNGRGTSRSYTVPTNSIDPQGLQQSRILTPYTNQLFEGGGGFGVGGSVAAAGVGAGLGAVGALGQGSDGGESEWEKELDFKDNGPKSEWQFSRCNTPEDHDCRGQLLWLKATYTRIKLLEMVGADMTSVKGAYNAAALRYMGECPYWVKVPLFRH